MAQRLRLADLKRTCPQELSHCEGYVWHLGTRIGKGSFGEVYLGWNSNGTGEVAVKVVRKEFFKQDPKVRENLEREIRILKLLRGCEYVVQLYHVQEMKHYIVLVMELCEYDLDHLVKVEPFKEDEIVNFLHQLAKGMKALREQNIVHRDLKPGNILIKHHPHTKRMLIKLADFGFARHFKDEGMKPIDMTSLAGTPVFMAPEALSCVFHPGKHYDDKVDIWSIGALLYKVIVGQCGFYAQLQDIPRILKHKGDAIAFERVAHSRKINYITELPPSVNSRFSEPFRAKMNELLKEMLKLDPTERMTFPEFFGRVDDIITSKIEVVNLLHGTSFKIINDPNLTVEDIVSATSTEYHLPSKFLVLFSTKSRYFIGGHTPLTPQQLTELLNKAGGAQGHALLYLLPATQLSPDKVMSDYSCLAPLKNELNDPNHFVTLISEHKFSDEMVGMIRLMQSQQKRQLEGLDEFNQFCSREITQFSANIYRQFTELGHQALAKAFLATQWLQEDLKSLSGSAQKSQLQVLLNTVAQHRDGINRLVSEGSSFGSSPNPTMSVDLKVEVLDKRSTSLADETKKLSRLTRDQIITVGNGIREDCQKQIDEVTGKVRDQLRPLYENLANVWGMGQKLNVLQRSCGQLDQLLVQIAQERALVLRSLSSSNAISESRQRKATPPGAGPGAPPVVVSPPMGWPQPPPPTSPAGSYYNSPTAAGQPGQEVESLRREKDDLTTKLTSKSQEVDKLNAELSTLKGQLAVRQRNSGSGSDEMEKTIVAGAVAANGRLSPNAGVEGLSLSPNDHKVLQELTHKLNQFCLTADKVPGLSVSAAVSQQQPTPAMSPGGTLYPDLKLDDFDIVSMRDKALVPSSQQRVPLSSSQDLQALLPQAKKLSELLQTNVSTLESFVEKSTKGTLTISNNHALIKIGRPAEYDKGDIILFHPVKLHRSRSTAPTVLHLEKPKPYIFMDHGSYAAFNIRPGRMPDLFLGKLTEKPRKLRFEDFPDLSSDIKEPTGDFYRVKAEPTDLKFSTQPGPARPPPPTNPAPQSGKTRTGSSSGGRGFMGGLLHHHKNTGTSGKGGFV